MYQATGGNIGIGTTAPASPLDVVGEIHAQRITAPGQYIQLAPTAAFSPKLADGIFSPVAVTAPISSPIPMKEESRAK